MRISILKQIIILLILLVLVISGESFASVKSLDETKRDYYELKAEKKYLKNEAEIIYNRISDNEESLDLLSRLEWIENRLALINQKINQFEAGFNNPKNEMKSNHDRKYIGDELKSQKKIIVLKKIKAKKLQSKKYSKIKHEKHASYIETEKIVPELLDTKIKKENNVHEGIITKIKYSLEKINHLKYFKIFLCIFGIFIGIFWIRKSAQISILKQIERSTIITVSPRDTPPSLPKKSIDYKIDSNKTTFGDSHNGKVPPNLI